MNPVKGSSTIDAIAHDPATDTLHVAFKSGGTYAYDKVPVHVYLDFLNAESPGAFLHRHIKGRYPHRRL